MWLQCDQEPGTETDRANREDAWPCAETLKSLVDLNEQCLELLAEQAILRTSTPTQSPMFQDLGDLWRRLDAHGRRRAATCPFLLVDAGFADPYRWRWVGGHRTGEREPTSFGTFFTAPRTSRVANQVFNNAWYLTRSQPMGAPLFLGMPLYCANLLRACSMRQVSELAEQHSDWLRPRWAGRPKVWRELLLAAISGDGQALERARMHGVQLLATELRALEQVNANDREMQRE
jgi:hypothetical protein